MPFSAYYFILDDYRLFHISIDVHTKIGVFSMLIYWCYSTGQLCVAKGELQMASDSFKIVLDEDGNNFPALLGQVIFFRLLKWSSS